VRQAVRAEVETDYDRLRALERAIFAFTDLTDIVGHASPVTEPFGGIDSDLAPAFVAALRGVAEAVRADAKSVEEQRAAAEDALGALQRELDKEGDVHPSEVPMSTAATVALRNVFAAACRAGGS
jgi:hypothetical protein